MSICSWSYFLINQDYGTSVSCNALAVMGVILNLYHNCFTNLSVCLYFSGGYGSNLLKLRRDPVSLGQNGGEFPIILGRDVSGVVVDCGSGVTHFKPGDEVRS